MPLDTMEKSDPYVWIRSRSLRNPHFPNRTSQVQEGGRSNKTGAPVRNNKIVNHDNNRNIVGIRRVRTAVSSELFDTGEQPAFIDHYGNLYQGAVPELDANTTGHKDNRPSSSARNCSGNSNNITLSNSVDDTGISHQQPGPKGASQYKFRSGSAEIPDIEVTDISLSQDLSSKPESKQLKQQLDFSYVGNSRTCPDSWPPVSSRYHRANGLQGTLSAVDRAWNRSATRKTGVEQVRPKSSYSRSSCPKTPSYKFRPLTASSAKTGARVVTFREMYSDGSDSLQDTISRTSNGDTASLSPESSFHSHSIKTRNIRPLSAVYNTVQAKRVIEERVRAMHSKRRASSASSRLNTAHPQSETTKWVPRSASNDAEPGQRAGFTSLSPLVRFRLLGRIAIRLRRLMDVIIANCCDNTLRSARELQWMTVYAETHDVNLAFNKHLYSRDRVSTHVPDWALSILQLKPEDRTVQQCRRLHALLRGLKSFDKFTDEIQMSLCRAFTLEKVAERRVVLKTGHIGVNFYFIYSGSVFVNMDDVTKDGRKFMRTVAVLTRGDSFGELALLQDIRRTATVSVREKCELLVVDKNVFASVCPKIFEKELAEKHAFISTLDLFSTNYWSPEAMRAMSMNAQIQEYKINKVIVADSSTGDWIYACMEGKCQVIRCLSLDKPIKDGGANRKTSDVVLSEEILQLLSSTTAPEGTGESVQGGDMRENLLSSLGLDYVQTGRKLYLDRGTAGHNESTTLTAIMKRRREEEKKDIVFLNVGVIEAGQIFDLPSLLDENATTDKASTLMLVSGGARIVRIKKAAFFDQASEQALDNTRTLASKRKNPSEDTILYSYKSKVAWDDFKESLVQNVLGARKHRYQPLYRASTKEMDRNMSKATRETWRESLRKSAKIISALQRVTMSNREKISSLTPPPGHSSSEEEAEIQQDCPPSTKTKTKRRKSNYYEDIERVAKQEVIIMRRRVPSARSSVRVTKNEDDRLWTPEARTLEDLHRLQ